MKWIQKQWHNLRVSFKWGRILADHYLAQTRRKEVFIKSGIKDQKLLDELWNRGNELFLEKWSLTRHKDTGYLCILRKDA